MFISNLDVVNGCIATLGESGLTTLSEDHPFRDTALQCLAEERDRILARGWWFNQEIASLHPDANSKYIYVPVDVYEVVVLNSKGFSVTQMGRRMYNANRRSYEWQHPITVRLTRKFDIEDIPYTASAAVRDAAIEKFQSRIDADQMTLQRVERTARLSWEELLRQDSRNQKHNLLRRPGMSPNAIEAFDRRDGTYIPGPNIIMPQ